MRPQADASFHSNETTLIATTGLMHRNKGSRYSITASAATAPFLHTGTAVRGGFTSAALFGPWGFADPGRCVIRNTTESVELKKIF
jgi:hypothetical protein